MKALLASAAKATIGFGLPVSAALSVVAYRSATTADRNIHEFPTPSSALAFHLLVWVPGLVTLALAGFVIGLVPVLLLRVPVRWPYPSGLGAAAFWVALAVAGVPFSLGLSAPTGILVVSVLLALSVSAISIGVALSHGSVRNAV